MGGDEQLSFGGGGEGEPAELSTTGEVTNDGGSRPKESFPVTKYTYPL